jgi:anti-anti-sigma factor
VPHLRGRSALSGVRGVGQPPALARPVHSRNVDFREGSDTRRAQGTLKAADSPRVAPAVLALQGDVDASTAQLLIDSMSAMIEWSVGDVVVDLTEVEFIDIVSVRVLDEARQLLWRESRGLTFRSPSKLAALVLGLFGLTNLIEATEGGQR